MFNDLINEKAKIVYRDGENVRAFEGKILAEDNQFVKVENSSTVLRINKKEIIKVEEKC